MSVFSYTVEKVEAVCDVQTFVQDCVDVEKFLACCAQCPNYGRRWSCPPYDFSPLDIWNKYTELRLFAWVLIPNDGTVQQLMDTLREEKTKFAEELLDLEQGNPGSYALAPGSCGLCQICTKTVGEPCRYPEKMRYSIEALGGDVGRTAEKWLQKPILWIRDDVLPDYLMLVGGLLLPEEAGGAINV